MRYKGRSSLEFFLFFSKEYLGSEQSRGHCGVSLRYSSLGPPLFGNWRWGWGMVSAAGSIFAFCFARFNIIWFLIFWAKQTTWQIVIRLLLIYLSRKSMSNLEKYQPGACRPSHAIHNYNNSILFLSVRIWCIIHCNASIRS